MLQIVFDLRYISIFYRFLSIICRINILGHDILGLGRVTYFEALSPSKCSARMSEFDVVWDVD